MLAGETFDSAFREEGFTTTLSFLQLLFLGALSGALFYLERRAFAGTARRAASLFWGLASPGFFFLAFDERFMIHENLDFAVHDLLELEETVWTDQIDVTLLILAAVIGVSVFVSYYRRLGLAATVRFLFWAGFAVLAISTVFDVASNHHVTVDFLHRFLGVSTVDSGTFGDWLGVIEESTKLLSEALFVGAFLHHLVDLGGVQS